MGPPGAEVEEGFRSFSEVEVLKPHYVNMLQVERTAFGE